MTAHMSKQVTPPRIRPSYSGSKRAHFILYASHIRAKRRVMEYYKDIKGKYAFADLIRDLLLKEERRLEELGDIPAITTT